ncbi:Alpha-mannosidase 2C1, partial [Tetrabaena socialis]
AATRTGAQQTPLPEPSRLPEGPRCFVRGAFHWPPAAPGTPAQPSSAPRPNPAPFATPLNPPGGGDGRSVMASTPPPAPAIWGPAPPVLPSSTSLSSTSPSAPSAFPPAPSSAFPSGPGPAAPSAWVPQHHRDITLGRLDGYLADGQFADVSLRSELWARRCSHCVRLHVYSHPKDMPYPPYDLAVNMPYRPAKVGDKFGPSWTTHWFRVQARVPEAWDGEGPLMFRWDSGCEAMLYSDGPTPRQGITAQRNEYILADTVVGGQELLFYVELAANGMFGNGPTENNIQPPDENRYFELKTAELAVPNLPVTALFHDLRALTGLARELPPGNVTGETALYVANKIVNTYRPRDPASVEAARALAASVLARRDPADRMQVYAVGHCHIDTAWLWPFSETHRKTARSWSAQLRLAERFPWHIFTASSAQQYEWLLADYLGLFAEIQAAAKRGSFVPVGGIRYFLTQKLSWNNINAFPHSSFKWAGLDGSTILTHFPPANTYNAQADAHDILATATGSKDKDRAPAAYMLYGNGDGGGGPTPDMCESLARLAGCRGLASLALASPGDFFRCLEASSHDLLTWRGELYFELHRGTYTSHAANKSDNRTCELLLREVEVAGALAAAVLPPGAYCYPRSEVEAIWKDVLLYQFHDVLPGSAIGRVYDVTAVRYPQMMSALRRMRDAALAALLAATAAPAARPGPAAVPAAGAAAAATPSHDACIPLFSDLLIAGAKPLPPPAHAAAVQSAVQSAVQPSKPVAGDSPVAWAFNSLAFRRREVVAVPAAALPYRGGGATVRQWCADGSAALVVVEAAPLSLTPITVGDLAAGATAAAASAAAVAAAGAGARAAGAVAPGGVGVATDGLGRLVLETGSGGGGRRGPVADPWVGGGATCVCVPRGGGSGVAVPGGGEGLVYVMANSMIRAVFDDRGRLLSLFDFAWQRELVPEGAAGNVFRLYEDIPLFWDAWDIEIYHLEKGWPAGEGLAPPEVTILESGPLRCRLQLTMQLSATSSLKQLITLTAVSPRLA